MPLQVALRGYALLARRPSLRWAGAAFALLLCVLPARGLRAEGGVFSTTEHGAPATGVQRLTGPDTPRGACVQCHFQHASADGASTGAANPYALFTANDNNLCGQPGCHADVSVNHLYPGLSAYGLAAHATSPAMVWPGPSPRRRLSREAGQCANCHDPHGYADGSGLIPTLGLAREQTLCLACHDGSPATTNLQFEITKTYHHPATNVTGRHLVSEDGDPSKFGRNNRHAECVDCHNVHQLTHPGLPPTAPDASGRLNGVSYLQVLNGSAWTAPAYVFHAADDPTPVQYEYQLCFKCHSSWTTLPLTTPSGGTPTDKAKEFNPNNPSYHPVEAAGRQTGLVMENSLKAPYTAASLLYCSDCHRSDSPSAARGPHGSTYRGLLRSNYRTDEPAAYLSTDYALCFDCHEETALRDDSENSQNTNFRFHQKHLAEARGNQPTLATCGSCHGNTHGSQEKRLMDFPRETHLTSFTSWTAKEDGAGTGQCTLTCHGYGHTGASY